MAETLRIFVSHSSNDSRWCRTFVRELRRSGADAVWYDESNRTFDLLTDDIDRALREHPIFIVVCSPASMSAPWVKREVAAAINLYDKYPSERTILLVVAVACDRPYLWCDFHCVCGPHEEGLSPRAAARRIMRKLAPKKPEVASAPKRAETARDAFEEGERLMRLGKYEDALIAFQRALGLEK